MLVGALLLFGTPLGVISGLPADLPLSLDSVLARASFAIKSPPGNVPLTLVDIDDEVYASWGNPCVTPRDQLARIIDAVAARGAAAIVVDVNLNCAIPGNACSIGTACRFDDFLSNYRGASPLIMVRDMRVDSGTHEGGKRRVSVNPTPYDGIVAKNPLISWGHEFYLTDGDGTVRRWQDSWEACTDGGTEVVAAVPVRVLAVLKPDLGERFLPALPERRGDCSLDGQKSPQHIVVIGNRILNAPRVQSDPNSPRRIPARQLLDTRFAMEDQGYFSLVGRVTIIGASHRASGDNWRTALGYIPGVELVAHTIQFSRDQLKQASGGTVWRERGETLLAYLTMVALFFWLRPLVASFIAVIALLMLAWWGLSDGRFEIFGSLELAIWCFILHESGVGLWKIGAKTGKYQSWSKLRVLLAERVRKEDAEERGKR
jgi:CHASE2 domain-containing sensor protein